MSDTMLSLREVCELLGISQATGRNWIRQGRLKPEEKRGNKTLYSCEQVRHLQGQLQSSGSGALRRRRNKTRVKGASFYAEYLAAGSPNRKLARQSLEAMSEELADRSSEEITSEQACSDSLRGNAQPRVSPVSLAAQALFAERIPAERRTSLSVLLQPVTEEVSPEMIPSYTYVPGEDLLGLLYISGRNLGSRKTDGIYYTPTRIVRAMVESLTSVIEERSTYRILDPCCGTGNFLINLPENVRPEQIYGMDIDAEAVDIARLNLALRYPDTDPELWIDHIRCADYLRTEPTMEYDLILGNPPWGSVYSRQEKDEWRRCYRSAGKIQVESCDLFLEQSLRHLRSMGHICFVLPEALLSVNAHCGIRRILLEQTDIRRLAYVGDVFDGVQCPCVCMTLQRTDRPLDTRGTIVVTSTDTFVIREQRAMSDERFSLAQTDAEYRILQKMMHGGERITLKGQAVFAMGIVTGDNGRYLREATDPDLNNALNTGRELDSSTVPDSGANHNADRNSVESRWEPIIRGCEIHPYQIDPAGNVIVYEPVRFQQSAAESSYRAEQKILYRFIGDRPVAAMDTQKRLTLNSCNILIPEIPGIPAAYVLALLNSRAAGFWWRKNYRTVKILRSQLEEFPMPVPTQEELQKVLELVDRITEEEGEERKIRLQQLDHLLERMYGLTEEESRSLEQ